MFRREIALKALRIRRHRDFAEGVPGRKRIMELLRNGESRDGVLPVQILTGSDPHLYIDGRTHISAKVDVLWTSACRNRATLLRQLIGGIDCPERVGIYFFDIGQGTV